MKPVRFGVVGVTGVIGGTHIRAIRQTPGAELVAVTDLSLQAAGRIASEARCELLKNFEWLIKRADIDAVCLCTPHSLHAEQAIQALKGRKHVLTEKPMAVTVADADKMIAAAEKVDRKLGVVFQYRYRPSVQAARQMLQRGQLGRIYRVALVHTAYKTQYYYDSAAWRGTWKGEGGGVLINQAPHFLDLLAYLVGMPSRVVAWNRTLTHRIEVEDTASALLEFPSGGQGFVHFNTVQVPGESRIEIVGDEGTLRIEDNDVHFFRPEKPLRQFTLTDRSHVYAYPRTGEVRVPLAGTEATHASVIRDFVAAIRDDRPPACDGEDGRRSLEIGNAMLLSSFSGKPVDLPVKRPSIRRLMKRLTSPDETPTQKVRTKGAK